MAAGIVLVREAGGVVTDLNGGDQMLANGQMLCANDPLHPQLLKLLKNARAPESI
jgi:myo-inositol-1(or 4)-monophosphatase